MCTLISPLCLASEAVELFDKTHNRLISVELFKPVKLLDNTKLPLVIINHGYGIKNTDYLFLANNLIANGYFVMSIQHDLEGDKPLPRKGNLYERRMPLWKRGVENILFVLKELKPKYPLVDYDNITLIGHSNGGDISMLIAKQHPNLAKNIISLDSLRMPFPRSDSPRILSLRAIDTQADEGVLPNIEEQKRLGINIVTLPDAKHIDFSDSGSIEIKNEVINLITKFLNGNI
jgi:predicted dienelactone hydrolase